MFTGLVEEVGRVRRVTARRGNRLLEIEARLAGELKAGDSVAVDGCCLTVVGSLKESFTVEAVSTTLEETNLARVRAGTSVNLERALALGDRLGGHFVQGHVDEVGTVLAVERFAGYWQVRVRVGPRNRGLLLEKGSASVNGVSLTIARLGGSEFRVNVIPHTWEKTTFRELRPGAKVNIEYDFLVKATQTELRTRNSKGSPD